MMRLESEESSSTRADGSMARGKAFLKILKIGELVEKSTNKIKISYIEMFFSNPKKNFFCAKKELFANFEKKVFHF